MNNKVEKIKITSAIFLAIVLVTGTITAISPLFITGVNAQGDPYYGMDSYDDRKPYGMDDSYGASDYGMDNDRKSYDNSYDKSQYQSYKPDYKPVKDDKRDKSKDSKVDIKKIKCINTNLNINGENAGNVSIGNKGQGYLGAYSSGGGGYGGEGYDNKQGKGFDCIINNNNTNVNAGAGNVTDGNGAVEDECVLCFLEADITGPIVIEDELTLLTLEQFLGIELDGLVTVGEELTISDLCRIIEGLTPPLTADRLRLVLNLLGIQVTNLVIFLECLIEAGIIIGPI